MAGERDGDGDAQENTKYRELNALPRVLLGILGLGVIGVGGIAVFRSANQAGTTTLLLVGGIACILALVGRVPFRWVISGTELDVSDERSELYADEMTDGRSPAQNAQTASRVVRASDAPDRIAAAVLERVAFEQTAIGLVMQAASEHGLEYRSEPGFANGPRLDAMLVSNSSNRNVRIIIEYKYRGSVPDAVAQVLSYLDAAESYWGGIVIMSSERGSRPRAEASPWSDRVWVLYLDDPEVLTKLSRAIETMLGSG